MARIRTIKPGFFLNETVASLPFEWRLLFVGLWTQADRDGRLEDRPMRLKAGLFPYDSLNIEDGLRRLADTGLIIRYQASGLSVIAIPTWAKHQQPHIREAVSELPPHPASTVPTLFEPVGSGKGREQEQEGVQAVGLQRKSSSRGLQSNGVLDRFDRFWLEYPKGTPKDPARKEFLKIAPDEPTLLRMVAAVRQSLASEQWRKDDGKFIPHARTWLHQKRWQDEHRSDPSGGEAVPRQQVSGCEHTPQCATPQECYRLLGESRRKAAVL